MHNSESGHAFITIERCQNLTYTPGGPEWQPWMEESTYIAPIVCKTPVEIDRYLSNLEIRGLFADNYLDFDDPTNPLKSQIIHEKLSSSVIDKPLTIQKQKVSRFTDRQSILQTFGIFKEDVYFTSEGVSTQGEMDVEQYNYENAIATVKIGLMKRGDVYQRKVYSVFDLLSAFGGLSIALFIIFQLFMITYSKRWFKLAITESEFKMLKNIPGKGRLNTVKGNKRKKEKLRK